MVSKTLQAGEVIFSTWLARALANTFGDELGASSASASGNLLLHALDAALAALAAAQGLDPAAWSAPRGTSVFSHPLLGTVASIPLSNRATYGQIVQLRTPRLEGENIFTLGQSGRIVLGPSGPVFDDHFFDQLPLYRAFEYKPMPLYLNRQLKE